MYYCIVLVVTLLGHRNLKAYEETYFLNNCF